MPSAIHRVLHKIMQNVARIHVYIKLGTNKCATNFEHFLQSTY